MPIDDRNHYALNPLAYVPEMGMRSLIDHNRTAITGRMNSNSSQPIPRRNVHPSVCAYVCKHKHPMLGCVFQYRMSHRSLPTCWIDTFIDIRRFRPPTRLFVATVRRALRERVGRHYSRVTADCESVSSGVQSVAGVCTVGCRGGTTPYYGDLVLTSGSKTHAWQFGILSKFAFHSHGSLPSTEPWSTTERIRLNCGRAAHMSAAS